MKEIINLVFYIPIKHITSCIILNIKFNIINLAPIQQASDPCNPSPCGSNALCNNGICTCIPEYQGDPYSICRPECVLNNECPQNKACIRNKCMDPCPGTCGQNALCDVYNHIPMCRCPQGMNGNAFIECLTYQGIKKIHK